MSERIINAERIEQIINVFGSFDENIKRIEQTYGVKITNRGTELKISGEDEAADRAGRAIEGLLLLAAKGETIDEQKVRYLIDLVSSGNEDKIGRNGEGRRLYHGQGPSWSRPRRSASSAI